MRWDEARIDATVTRQFVSDQLQPHEAEVLDQALRLGNGPAEGTYWEWIRDRARRIFLILLDLGLPNQIFGLVDDCWDDGDLPISLDQAERLALTAAGKNSRFDKKLFYYRQFHYLVRSIEKGGHLVYDHDEVVPLHGVDRRPVASHAVGKVELPNYPGVVLSRRCVAVGRGSGVLSSSDFLCEINRAKNVQNGHIASYFASYIHQGFGYVLFTPAGDYNLRTVLTNMPTPLKALAKEQRREHIMNWIHCLVDALCYLHSRGYSHGNIRLSTVLFNTQHHVFFADLSRLGNEPSAGPSDKAAFDKEAYDYAAPEQWFRPRKATLSSRPLSPSDQHASSQYASETGSPGSVSPLHAPTPQLNPQAADIFSLGCVILELLSLLMKRSTRSFASHRAARNKQAGRGGAVPDASFHKNLGQLDSWMAGLVKEAGKKKGKGKPVFAGVGPMLAAAARMIAAAPQNRPTADEVEQATYRILREDCQIAEPHCVHQYGGWDFGIGRLAVAGEADGPPVLVGQRPSVRSSPSFAHKRGASTDEGRGRSSPAMSGFEAIQNIRTNRVRTLSREKQVCSPVLTRESRAVAAEALEHLPKAPRVQGTSQGGFGIY